MNTQLQIVSRPQVDNQRYDGHEPAILTEQLTESKMKQVGPTKILLCPK